MSEKILVVDDDRQMVNTICDILRHKGYETIPAYSGEEAVAKVKTDKPGCVLMDIRMPGINGVAALKIIREAAPDLPVLLMSAYATEEQAEVAKQQGAYAVLTKPIDIQGLLSFLSLLRKEESVLVVDDDPLFCKTLNDILQARGYQVKTEVDPGRVLGNLEQNNNLMILLDLKLGDVDGVDVLAEIRAKYPTKPVVLVTGFQGKLTDSIKKGLQMGAYACLYKPFEIEELVGIIEEICQKKLRQVFGEPF